MSKKTIYIHIGTMKTGTTTIQDFLMCNKKLLKTDNYIVYTPDRNSHPKVSDYSLRTMINKINLINKQDYPNTEFTAWLDKFVCEIKNTATDNVILSEELLWNIIGSPAIQKQQMFIDFFSMLKTFAEVKIIVYLRRQDYYIMSAYQQDLKTGKMLGKTCEEWIKKNINNYVNRFTHYKDRLTNLIKIVEKQNITVRIFEKKQFIDQSLIADFMHSINLDLTDDYNIIKNKRNPGLSPFMAEIIRCMTTYNDGKNVIAPFVTPENKSNIRLFNHDKQHEFLSPTERNAIIKKYKQDNEWVAKEFFSRSDGTLFYDPLPQNDKTWKKYTISASEVKSFFKNADFLNDKQRQELQHQTLAALKIQKWLKTKRVLIKYLPILSKTKHIVARLPKPIQYPIHKVWHICKLFKAKLLGETV